MSKTSPYRRGQSKRDALAALNEFYCLRPKDFARLHFNTKNPSESNTRSINATLQLLRQENLVYPIRYYPSKQTIGQATFVYGLTRKAVRELESGRLFDEHSERTLDHELEISLFHLDLKELCEKHGWHLTWEQDSIDGKREINPDAFFAITKPELPQNKNTFPFFLEIERSKIGNYRDGKPSILRKLEKYADHFDSSQCEKEWGIRKFRVLIVQPNETRRTYLVHTLAEKLPTRMFWLTTEDLYRQNIGGEIWKTPKDGEKVAYSFQQL
jgi:hypothetical protein